MFRKYIYCSVTDSDGEIRGVVLGYQPPYFYWGCTNCAKSVPEKVTACPYCGQTTSTNLLREFHTTLLLETNDQEIKEVKTLKKGNLFFKTYFNIGLHIPEHPQHSK